MLKYFRALVMIVIILGLMIVGQILPLAIADHLNFSENTAIIAMTILYPIIVIGGGYLLNRFLFRQRLPLVSKWQFRWWPVGYIILADVLIYLFSWIARTNFYPSSTTMSDWWLQFAMNVISAPLVEEYTFRGYIFGAFDSIFSRSVTIWLTAIMFGLIHLSSLGHAAWYNAVFLVVSYTAMGMLFTLIAVGFHSLWASFVAHVVNNLLIYVGWNLGCCFQCTKSIMAQFNRNFAWNGNYCLPVDYRMKLATQLVVNKKRHSA